MQQPFKGYLRTQLHSLIRMFYWVALGVRVTFTPGLRATLGPAASLVSDTGYRVHVHIFKLWGVG